MTTKNTIERLANGRYRARLWFPELDNGILGDEKDTPDEAIEDVIRKVEETVLALERLRGVNSEVN